MRTCKIRNLSAIETVFNVKRKTQNKRFLVVVMRLNDTAPASLADIHLLATSNMKRATSTGADDETTATNTTIRFAVLGKPDVRFIPLDSSTNQNTDLFVLSHL